MFAMEEALRAVVEDQARAVRNFRSSDSEENGADDPPREKAGGLSDMSESVLIPLAPR